MALAHESDAVDSYGVDDLLKDVFMVRERAEAILASLRRKQNVILTGPPGVGKSFIAKRLAYSLMGNKDPSRVEMIQFHQSYAYEDFVQGWRPNSDGGFVLRNGVFHEFCSRARQRSDLPHVFVIDEINRGNLSKVFGELMLLIESDKRGPEHAIALTYAEDQDDRFYVPENVFIVGLMNTADRSLAMVDYALRRRFVFNGMGPAFGNHRFKEFLHAQGVDGEVVNLVVSRLKKLNDVIADDRKNLGPGFAIGHSYFCPRKPGTYGREWFDAVVREEIAPLLWEYWFDDPDKAEGVWLTW